MITAAGTKEPQARSLLGKWRKVLGDDETMKALSHCQAHAITDPVSYVEGAIRSRRQDNGGQGDWMDFARRKYGGQR